MQDMLQQLSTVIKHQSDTLESDWEEVCLFVWLFICLFVCKT